MRHPAVSSGILLILSAYFLSIQRSYAHWRHDVPESGSYAAICDREIVDARAVLQDRNAKKFGVIRALQGECHRLSVLGAQSSQELQTATNSYVHELSLAIETASKLEESIGHQLEQLRALYMQQYRCHIGLGTETGTISENDKKALGRRFGKLLGASSVRISKEGNALRAVDSDELMTRTNDQLQRDLDEETSGTITNVIILKGTSTDTPFEDALEAQLELLPAR